MGKKYIIELPENTHWIQWIMEGTKDHHPYMDWKLVEDLTPYTEPDTEAIEKVACQRGLNDAWEAAKKIVSIPTAELHTMLDKAVYYDTVFRDCTASECIEKIRAYEEKKKAKDIKVGDEVMLQADHEEKGICISKQDNKMQVMWSDGSAGKWEEGDFIKTGRHFPELAEILKKMGADE